MNEVAKSIRSAGLMVTLAILGTGVGTDGYAAALVAVPSVPALAKFLVYLSLAAFVVALVWVVVAVYQRISEGMSESIAALPDADYGEGPKPGELRSSQPKVKSES